MEHVLLPPQLPERGDAHKHHPAWHLVPHRTGVRAGSRPLVCLLATIAWSPHGHWAPRLHPAEMRRREGLAALFAQREEHGLSLRTLSRRTGIPLGTLSWWHGRLRQDPTLSAAPSSSFVELVPPGVQVAVATARSSCSGTETASVCTWRTQLVEGAERIAERTAARGTIELSAPPDAAQAVCHAREVAVPPAADADDPRVAGRPVHLHLRCCDARERR